MKEKWFDVVAINVESRKVRMIAENKGEKAAEAIETMAVMRRGVEDEFFCVVPHGKYAEGETWAGA